MTSDKRDMIDFKNFPGKVSINGHMKGVYVFPPINSIDSLGRTRIWKIFARLVRVTDTTHLGTRDINWSLDTDEMVPIEESHYDNKTIPNDIVCQMWTHSTIAPEANKFGNYTITRSAPSYVMTGKNIGKKNETNVFTQALILCRSKYLKKLQSINTGQVNRRYFPMAVHKYTACPRDEMKHIRYPCGIQRKLDGGRTVSYWDQERNSARLYTRKLKDLDGNENIINAMNALYGRINGMYEGIYFDGEIYKHNVALQNIIGYMRRESTDMSDNIQLEYHIFDVFFPVGSNDMKNIPFIERTIILDHIFAMVSDGSPIKKVSTYIADSEEEQSVSSREL
jgi:hypothetical protein